ncbi:MAG: hypothetical protein HQL60_00815, partial [Magnetococcales bacterium]|nr:hypothetical protein [Magnetococcales bacterium]
PTEVTAAPAAPAAESSDAEKLDAVLQQQINDKLKGGAPASGQEEAEKPAAVAESAEAVPEGVLVPPPVRVVPLSQRNKQEPIRSAAQAKLNEAYLQQLKGADPLPEGLRMDPIAPSQPGAQPSKPAVMRTVKRRRPVVHRRVTADGGMEIPVESLGTGIFNALGDMVGGVVQITRSLKKRAGGASAPVAPIADDYEEDFGSKPIAAASSTVRMANRMTSGVLGVVTGVGDIVKGGSNIVVGTVGVVTAPVVSAVGSVLGALKPARKPAKPAAADDGYDDE